MLICEGSEEEAVVRLAGAVVSFSAECFTLDDIFRFLEVAWPALEAAPNHQLDVLIWLSRREEDCLAIAGDAGLFVSFDYGAACTCDALLGRCCCVACTYGSAFGLWPVVAPRIVMCATPGQRWLMDPFGVACGAVGLAQAGDSVAAMAFASVFVFHGDESVAGKCVLAAAWCAAGGAPVCAVIWRRAVELVRSPGSVVDATALLERWESLPDALVGDVQSALEFGLGQIAGDLRVPLLGLLRKLVVDARFHAWIRGATAELTSRWSAQRCEERVELAGVIGDALSAGVLDNELDTGLLSDVLVEALELRVQAVRDALRQCDEARLSPEVLEALRALDSVDPEGDGM
jgi:hypothetical protein